MAYEIGDKVKDRGGRHGTVVQVTNWRGSRWYDVRLWCDGRSPGVVVMYDSDMEPDEEEEPPIDDTTPGPGYRYRDYPMQGEAN